MKTSQVRKLITDTLGTPEMEEQFGKCTFDVVELLLLTCAAESAMGKYIMQVGGPARGIFQMEPNTEKDIWENWLKYKPQKEAAVEAIMMGGGADNLTYNLVYQVLMARIHYLRVPASLPDGSDAGAMAAYHKKFYNTYLGSATIGGTIAKYKRYVLEG